VKIGIVGGTGDIGEGIAMRLSSNHDVVIGSREEDKAVESSEVCYATVTKLGLPCSVSGYSNQEAVDRSDIVILAIPFKHVEPTLASLHGFEKKLVISPVNPMEKRDFFVFTPLLKDRQRSLSEDCSPGNKALFGIQYRGSKQVEGAHRTARPCCTGLWR